MLDLRVVTNQQMIIPLTVFALVHFEFVTVVESRLELFEIRLSFKQMCQLK